MSIHAVFDDGFALGHHDVGHHQAGHNDIGAHDIGHHVQWGLGLGSEFAHYNPAHPPTTLLGDPADLDVWHIQSLPDDCAIVSQEFILNELTGHIHSEAECVNTAIAYGAYHGGGSGTALNHVGDVLQAYGVPVERHYFCTLDDIRGQLNQNHKVIVGVDSTVMHGQPVSGHRVDHAVQIVAIDDSDPQHPNIILNDPGNPEGRGEVIPSDKFFEVWGPSGNFMMNTTGSVSPSATAVTYTPSAAGYYNADGTYHWSSDNTNRDPHNGTIVSWG